jgi:hypothetical protein
MALTQELIDQVTKYAGRFSADVLLGWEAGLKSEKPIGGVLVPLYPPEDFDDRRSHDWMAGCDAGIRYKIQSTRTTRFIGKGPDGEMSVVREGWVGRHKVIKQMKADGAYGSIDVLYVDGDEIQNATDYWI